MHCAGIIFSHTACTVGYRFPDFQSRIRRHVCVLNVFYMGPYSGANWAERPQNGASRLHSYLRKESVSMYDLHIA